MSEPARDGPHDVLIFALCIFFYSNLRPVVVQYPILTRSNYNEWTLLMRVNLQAQVLWHDVELEEGETIEYREESASVRRHIL